MPNFKKLWNEYPHSQLLASERAVGLEKGQMGNSEVGHTTIGAGRLIKQNFMEITDWFNKKEILKNENFLKKAKPYRKFQGLGSPLCGPLGPPCCFPAERLLGGIAL